MGKLLHVNFDSEATQRRLPTAIRPGIPVTPPQPRMRLLGSRVRYSVSEAGADALWQACVSDMQLAGLRKVAK